MQVKQLIEELQNYEPELEVVVTSDFGSAFTPNFRGVDTFYDEEADEEFDAVAISMDESRGQG